MPIALNAGPFRRGSLYRVHKICRETAMGHSGPLMVPVACFTQPVALLLFPFHESTFIIYVYA